MKFEPIEPPRRFVVGAHEDVELSDCGRVALDPDEQISLTTDAGAEYDVTRKDWGFYATPSLNERLAVVRPPRGACREPGRALFRAPGGAR